MINIFYSYIGKVGINYEKAFEEIATEDDKERKRENIIILDI